MECIFEPTDDADEGSDTPASFCKKENIGHTKFYEEVNSGRLKAKKIGSKTVVLPEERRRWRANLPDYVPANDGTLPQGARPVAGVVNGSVGGDS